MDENARPLKQFKSSSGIYLEGSGEQILKNLVYIAVITRLMQHLSWEIQPKLNDLHNLGMKTDKYEEINNDIYKLSRRIKDMLSKTYETLPIDLIIDENCDPILNVFNSSGNALDVVYENVQGTALNDITDLIDSEVLRYIERS